MTKTQEITIKLPDWVNYLAQDEDGQWWAYEAEPNQSHNGWYENEVGRILRLNKGQPNPEWKISLRKYPCNKAN